MSNLSSPIRVYMHWIWRGATLLGAAVFLFLAWFTWRSVNGNHVIALVFVGFALLCAYEVILTSSVFEIDNQGVTRKDLFATYRIQWSEVKSLESNGQTFALLGEDKYLTFNLAMAGKGRLEFSAAMERIVKQRHIKIEGLTRIYVSQKNTKV